MDVRLFLTKGDCPEAVVVVLCRFQSIVPASAARSPMSGHRSHAESARIASRASSAGTSLRSRWAWHLFFEQHEAGTESGGGLVGDMPVCEIGWCEMV
jgi:hypothetical protein